MGSFLFGRLANARQRRANENEWAPPGIRFLGSFAVVAFLVTDVNRFLFGFREGIGVRDSLHSWEKMGLCVLTKTLGEADAFTNNVSKKEDRPVAGTF